MTKEQVKFERGNSFHMFISLSSNYFITENIDIFENILLLK